MQKLTWMIFGLLAAAASAAQAGDGAGITPSAEQLQWARWQGRVSLGTEPAGLKLNTVSLMGDYYFTGSLLGSRRAGGFRATSGLLLGPRTQSWLGQPGLSAGNSFSIATQAFGKRAPNVGWHGLPRKQRCVQGRRLPIDAVGVFLKAPSPAGIQ